MRAAASLVSRAAARRALSTAPGAAAAAAGGLNFTLTEEQKAMQELARNFAREEMMPLAAAHDRSGEYPQAIFRKAWELGLVNLHVPERFGGAGMHAVDGVIVGEELAYACTGMSTAMEANGLASAPVIIAGTDAQKKEYLGRLTAAPIQAAYCVTEPGAGSDVAGLKTRAVKKGDEWLISGSKMWITNGAQQGETARILARGLSRARPTPPSSC